MSKVQKINYSQKEILGNFMAKHTDLAKSLLPNSSQGKAKANQLWEQLTLKLNASGPPIKDAKMWRKVYADQKQNVKRKLSFNKFSKRTTGGGPYQEKVISQVEEQILAAAGIEVAVEGLKSVKTFGSLLQTNPTEDLIAPNSTNENVMQPTTSQKSPCVFSGDDDTVIENVISSLLEIEDDSGEENAVPVRKNLSKTCRKQKETKHNLLQKNISSSELYQKEMLKRLDTLIEIKNKNLELKKKDIELKTQLMEIKKKTLEMKEKEVELNFQIKEMELQIRRKELESINIQMQSIN